MSRVEPADVGHDRPVDTLDDERPLVCRVIVVGVVADARRPARILPVAWGWIAPAAVAVGRNGGGARRRRLSPTRRKVTFLSAPDGGVKRRGRLRDQVERLVWVWVWVWVRVRVRVFGFGFGFDFEFGLGTSSTVASLAGSQPLVGLIAAAHVERSVALAAPRFVGEPHELGMASKMPDPPDMPMHDSETGVRPSVSQRGKQLFSEDVVVFALHLVVDGHVVGHAVGVVIDQLRHNVGHVVAFGPLVSEPALVNTEPNPEDGGEAVAAEPLGSGGGRQPSDVRGQSRAHGGEQWEEEQRRQLHVRRNDVTERRRQTQSRQGSVEQPQMDIFESSRLANMLAM
eukprot:scaffold30720_cov48-Phaeocystis_antarctica.AAC.2